MVVVLLFTIFHHQDGRGDVGEQAEDALVVDCVIDARCFLCDVIILDKGILNATAES